MTPQTKGQAGAGLLSQAEWGHAMNILILGSGGREHALAWAVKQNPKCDRLIVAPGNAGIAMLAECADLDILDGAAVVGFCEENAIDFVIIGPEAPLAAGVADATRAAGLLTFGPSAEAAKLEASKGFTKEICDACGAPTAAYARFTESQAAKEYIRKQGAPIVVKADGLAAGKGVIVAMTEGEALAAIDDMLMTEPPPALINSGKPYLQLRKVPKRSSLMARQNSSMGASVTQLSAGVDPPATLEITFSAPNVLTTCAIAA